MLQMQMRAKPKQTTDKTSALTFKEDTQTINIFSDFPLPLSQIQVSWPAQQQSHTYSANGLLHQKNSIPHCFFNVSLENTSVSPSLLPLMSATVQEPPRKPSAVSFNHFLGCNCALRFAWNQLPSDDYQTLEIAALIIIYLQADSLGSFTTHDLSCS